MGKQCGGKEMDMKKQVLAGRFLSSLRTSVMVSLSLLLGAMSVLAGGFDFNQPGNILIADQFNNRVIEIEPDGDIVWSFGRGPNDFSSKGIIGVNDAQRVGAFTLMAG